MSSKLKPWFYLAYASVLSVMLIGALKVTISSDASDAMLEKSGQSYQNYIEYLDHFPSDVGAVVAITNILCSNDGWQLIKDVELAFRSSAVVRNTISIASPGNKFISSTETSVNLSRFTDLEFEPNERCARAYDYPPFQDLLVKPSGSAIAIYLVAENKVDTKSFANAVEKIRDEFNPRALELGGRILLTGDPIMSTEIARVISEDITFVLGLISLLLVISFAITRSIRVVMATLLTTGLSLIGAVGVMGWLGLEITPGTALAIFLLGPLSAAFVIHAHGYAMRDKSSNIVPKEAIIPTIFAGLTTAILFGCTGLTPAPDVRSLALLGTAGIAFATFSVFTVAYPLLNSKNKLEYVLSVTFPRWIVAKPWIAFALLFLLILEVWIGFSKIRFEYEAADYLPLTNEKRGEFEEIGKWFGRMSIPLLIKTEPESTNDPEIWRTIESLKEKLEPLPGNTQIASFYPQISTATRALTKNNEDTFLDFPDTVGFMKQLFLLFEKDDYEFYVNDAEDRLVITIHVPFISSADYFILKNIVQEHFEETELEVNFVGRVSGFFESGHRVGIDNLRGLAIGAGIVFIFLLLLFKSITLSIIGMVINCIPVLTSLAALGLAGVPIDLGSSIVTAIAFGIVVDDSTHLNIHIKRLQSQGYDPATAVLRAISDLIAPITATTMMTCIGFCVLFAAEMQPFHDFATTILIALLSALIADIVILPVLVKTFVRDFVQPIE